MRRKKHYVDGTQEFRSDYHYVPEHLLKPGVTLTYLRSSGGFHYWMYTPGPNDSPTASMAAVVGEEGNTNVEIRCV